ncbi:MAG: hypothetical protein ACK5KU_05670 [Beutenbergiaceae bacterium]
MRWSRSRDNDPDSIAESTPAWGTPGGTETPTGPNTDPYAGLAASQSSVPTDVTVPGGTHISVAIPSRPPTPRRPIRWGIVVPLSLLGIAMLVIIIQLVRMQGMSAPPSGPLVSLEAQWTVDSESLTGEYGYELASVDGSADSPILSTSHGDSGSSQWIIRLRDESPQSADHLVALEPTTGAVTWQREVTDAHCTQTEAAELLCLIDPLEGEAMTLTWLNPESGEPLNEVAAQVNEPIELITPFADGLLTLSQSGNLALLNADGTIAWSSPLGVYDWDREQDELYINQYSDSVLITVGSMAVVLVEDDGAQPPRACTALVVTESAWLCEEAGTVTSFAPDGSELWREADYSIHLLNQSGAPSVTAITEHTDGTLSLIEPTTGQLQAPFSLSDDNVTVRQAGDEQTTVLWTEDVVGVIAADGSQPWRWTSPIRDSGLVIAEIVVVDDTLIIGGRSIHAYDVSSGEYLWRADSTLSQLWARDGALVGTYGGQLIRYQLP